MEEKIKSCEVLDDWSALLPRDCYRNFECIDVKEPWFDVYSLPHDVYCIYEGGHFQEVLSYLICGSEKSLLLDTGMGIGNIKTVVDALTEKPVFVVNCHNHFDHVGNNNLFEQVFAWDDVLTLERLRKGYTQEELAHQVVEGMTIREFPSAFDPEHFFIPGCSPIGIPDGHTFDLGNRIIQVIHAPGHTRDSIVLHDTSNHLLFTGDVFYPAALYTHFSDTLYGLSDFYGYQRTMEKLSGMAESLALLYCGHNEPLAQPQKLVECAVAFRDIIQGNAPCYEDEGQNRRYDFAGFSIVTKGMEF